MNLSDLVLTWIVDHYDTTKKHWSVIYSNEYNLALVYFHASLALEVYDSYVRIRTSKYDRKKLDAADPKLFDKIAKMVPKYYRTWLANPIPPPLNLTLTSLDKWP